VPVSTPSDDQSRPPTPSGGADPAPRPTRRVFNPEYKRAMVAEYENAPTARKVRSYVGRASTPLTSSNGHELAMREP